MISILVSHRPIFFAVPISDIRYPAVLDQFRLADENNRILERILHHMTQGDLDAAHKCRSRKVTHRDRYTGVESIITREPEFERVQRLQRLYEGLSLYDLDQATTDELAEKAFHRLQEVDSMISEGYLCDIFIPPLLEILDYFDEPTRSRKLLIHYKKHVPENPNTLRYLCEWYKRQHTTDLSGSQTVMNVTTVEPTSPDRKRSSLRKSLKRILTLRIQFSRHVLPEPAPTLPHSSRPLDAMELAFLVLDHPSWAVYAEPWKLLKRAVLAVGKHSPEVSEAVRIRKRIWSRLYFSQFSEVPAASIVIRRLFSNTAKLSAPVTISENSDANLLGPLLTIQPIFVGRGSIADTSEADSSI
ncbi:hypothetical protein FBUS_00617 [Fasciolopsis buskii]|uniref:Uncharacterized protein n=1 Tax=Fasciolopsis buskii TaxID=27845 RepID=A0A8E0VK03_9TREM|nr:hypothetical protein FBUS_00617 [Fasciolopsis buski]